MNREAILFQVQAIQSQFDALKLMLAEDIVTVEGPPTPCEHPEVVNLSGFGKARAVCKVCQKEFYDEEARVMISTRGHGGR